MAPTNVVALALSKEIFPMKMTTLNAALLAALMTNGAAHAAGANYTWQAGAGPSGVSASGSMSKPMGPVTPYVGGSVVLPPQGQPQVTVNGGVGRNTRSTVLDINVMHTVSPGSPPQTSVTIGGKGSF